METAGTTTTTVREGEATTTTLRGVEMDIPTTQEPGTMDRETTTCLVNLWPYHGAACAESSTRDPASTKGQWTSLCPSLHKDDRMHRRSKYGTL